MVCTCATLPGRSVHTFPHCIAAVPFVWRAGCWVLHGVCSVRHVLHACVRSAVRGVNVNAVAQVEEVMLNLAHDHDIERAFLRLFGSGGVVPRGMLPPVRWTLGATAGLRGLVSILARAGNTSLARVSIRTREHGRPRALHKLVAAIRSRTLIATTQSFRRPAAAPYEPMHSVTPRTGVVCRALVTAMACVRLHAVCGAVQCRLLTFACTVCVLLFLGFFFLQIWDSRHWGERIANGHGAVQRARFSVPAHVPTNIWVLHSSGHTVPRRPCGWQNCGWQDPCHTDLAQR